MLVPATCCGEPYILNHDAPFTPPFLWRKEAAVAVVETQLEAPAIRALLSEPTNWLSCAQTRSIVPLNRGRGMTFARAAFSSILQMHIGSPFIFMHLQG